MNAALQTLGHRPDPSFDLTFVIGPVLTDVMGQVLAHYGDTRVDEAVAVYRRHYGEVGLYDVTLYDGIAALLASLQAARFGLFLATSKRTAFAVRILDHLRMSHHFDGIYGSEPDGSRDGKPELIADILRREAIRPDDAVMVGDRRYDIAGAHANGLRGIGVLWGYGDRQELTEAGADLLVASPADLLAGLQA